MSKVVFAECRTYVPVEVLAATQRIFETLGVHHLFRRTEKVLIKPNFLLPSGDENPTTTNSQVLLALCRLLLDLGCQVAIGESPGIGTLTACIARKGLGAPLKKMGVSVVEFTRPQPVLLPEGRMVKSVPVAAELRDFDAVISAAKLKTHCQFYFTGCVKNLYGCLPGMLKSEYHLRFAEAERLSCFFLDVHDAVKPRLGFMDAVVGMEGEGPSSRGKAKPAGFLSASQDCAALDIESMKAVSLSPALVPYLKEQLSYPAAEVINLGEMAKVVFDPPSKMESVLSTIPLPAGLKKVLKYLVVPVPVFSAPPACKLCGNCQDICPSQPKAAFIKKGRVMFRRRHCISCFCCFEMCPHKAIKSSQPFLMRRWRRLKVPSL
ncbi:MAG: DUF362 domain-containing protein [Candidatus Omnitrophica bacterium]|nr:DUF362 domain-containing protein [Candidatus Omnitrophota bacterium]